MLSSLVAIRGQSCAGGYQYSPCSSNGQCVCLQLSFSSSTFLCGLVSLSCAQYSVCQSPNDFCPSGSICVRHPQCSSQSLCFPMDMLDEQACPIVTGETSSSLFFEQIVEKRVCRIYDKRTVVWSIELFKCVDINGWILHSSRSFSGNLL